MTSFGIEKYNSQIEQFIRGAPRYVRSGRGKTQGTWRYRQRLCNLKHREERMYVCTRKNDDKRRENLISVKSTGMRDGHGSTRMRGERKRQKKQGKK